MYPYLHPTLTLTMNYTHYLPYPTALCYLSFHTTTMCPRRHIVHVQTNTTEYHLCLKWSPLGYKHVLQCSEIHVTLRTVLCISEHLTTHITPRVLRAFSLEILSKRLQHYKLQKYSTNKQPCTENALDYTQLLQYAIRHEYMQHVWHLCFSLAC
jgi:hypothetical protein